MENQTDPTATFDNAARNAAVNVVSSLHGGVDKVAATAGDAALTRR